MGIPVLRGRAFDVHDDSASIPVAIVSAALAARYWPGEDAVGKRILRVASTTAPPQTLEVVGIAGNVMDAGYNAPEGQTVYVPFAQASVSRLSIVVESGSAPGTALAALRRALMATDPIVAASATATLDTLVAQANALPWLRAIVLLGFAMIAVAIVGLGSYGVMRQLVANREREFALRLIFGAPPGDLGRAVLAHAARLTIPGVAAGLVVAWLLAGTLRAFVFGIAPRSLLVFAVVSLGVLTLEALTAAPSAVRAMRVDARKSLSAG
jgi:putative ABC transport system permease protein